MKKNIILYDEENRQILECDACSGAIISIFQLPGLEGMDSKYFCIQITNYCFLYTEISDTALCFDKNLHSFSSIAFPKILKVNLRKLQFVEMAGKCLFFPIKCKCGYYEFLYDSKRFIHYDCLAGFDGVFLSVHALDDRRILLADMNNNYIWLLDIHNNELRIAIRLDKANYIRSICSDDKYVYALTIHGATIYVYDKVTLEYVRSIIIKSGKESYYQFCIDCGEFLLVLKRVEGNSVIVNKKDDSIEIIYDSELSTWYQSYEWIDEKTVWLKETMCDKQFILLFDVISMSIKKKSIHYYKIYKSKFDKNIQIMVKENENYLLSEFIETVV